MPPVIFALEHDRSR